MMAYIQRIFNTISSTVSRIPVSMPVTLATRQTSRVPVAAPRQQVVVKQTQANIGQAVKQTPGLSYYYQKGGVVMSRVLQR